MKYKVKFRVTKGGTKGQKFSINLAEGNSFLLGPATVGLHVPGHDDDFSPCMFSIRDGALVVTDRGTKSGIQHNNRSGDEFVLKPGDLIQVVEHSIEILEAPVPQKVESPEEDAPATQFLDISEGVHNVKVRKEPTIETQRPVTDAVRKADRKKANAQDDEPTVETVRPAAMSVEKKSEENIAEFKAERSSSIKLPGTDPDAAWSNPEQLNPIDEQASVTEQPFEGASEEFQLEESNGAKSEVQGARLEEIQTESAQSESVPSEPENGAIEEFADVQFSDDISSPSSVENEVASTTDSTAPQTQARTPQYDSLPDPDADRNSKTALISGDTAAQGESTQPDLPRAEELIPQENPMAAFTASAIDSLAPPPSDGANEVSELEASSDTPIPVTPAHAVLEQEAVAEPPSSSEQLPAQVASEALAPLEPQAAAAVPVKKGSSLFDVVLSLLIAAVGGMVFSFGNPIEINRVPPRYLGAISAVALVGFLITLTALLRKFLKLDVGLSQIARFFGFSVLAMVPMGFIGSLPSMVQLGVAALIYFVIAMGFLIRFKPMVVRFFGVVGVMTIAICALGYSYFQGVGIFSRNAEMQAWNEQQSIIRKAPPAQLETAQPTQTAVQQPPVVTYQQPSQVVPQAAPQSFGNTNPPTVVAPPGPPPVQVVRRPVEAGTPVPGAQRPVMTDPMGKAKFVQGVKNGDLNLVREAVQKNHVDPSLRLDNGATGLMCASVFGHTEIVKYLVSKGADLNARDSAGTTALMWATVNGHRKVVEYLLGHGADRTIRRSDGDTAEDIARKFKRRDIASILEPRSKSRSSARSSAKNVTKKTDRSTASRSSSKKASNKTNRKTSSKNKNSKSSKKKHSATSSKFSTQKKSHAQHSSRSASSSTRAPSSVSGSRKSASSSSNSKYQRTLPQATKSPVTREE